MECCGVLLMQSGAGFKFRKPYKSSMFLLLLLFIFLCLGSQHLLKDDAAGFFVVVILMSCAAACGRLTFAFFLYSSMVLRLGTAQQVCCGGEL